LADVEAEDVVEVVAFLEGLGVEVWLDGGWGVDALLGRQRGRMAILTW
jgi:lincosamide nucleotidyltransferase A/C/D/E